MQFAQTSALVAYRNLLDLCTITDLELNNELDEPDKTYSFRRYLPRVIGLKVIRNASLDAHNSVGADEAWIKAHKLMLRDEWMRHIFIATGLTPEPEFDDIISCYEHLDFDFSYYEHS